MKELVRFLGVVFVIIAILYPFVEKVVWKEEAIGRAFLVAKFSALLLLILGFIMAAPYRKDKGL